MKRTIHFTKIILIAGLIFTTLVAVSNTTPSTASVPDETEKTIRSYFKFPQVLLPHTEIKPVQSNKVEVLFTTDRTGKVNFVMAKTTDKELKREIENQFLNLQLNKLKQNVVHSVVLNFKTI